MTAARAARHVPAAEVLAHRLPGAVVVAGAAVDGRDRLGQRDEHHHVEDEAQPTVDDAGDDPLAADGGGIGTATGWACTDALWRVRPASASGMPSGRLEGRRYASAPCPTPPRRTPISQLRRTPISWRRSSTSRSVGASCSRRPRSTAASARPTTTGPIGVLLLRNVKDAWWRSMVQLRDDVVGLDAAILSPPAIWEASGHLANFTDPLVDCKVLPASASASTSSTIPTPARTAARRTRFTEARQFNLMFKTHAGPIADAGAVVYLRPETAQGMFVNFANVLQTSRKKPPFGIAQVGKSFRNEITPGNFVFRTREFEQMEMEFFVPPDEAPQVVRVLVQRALPVVPRPRHPRGQAPPAPPRRRRAHPLLERHVRRGVPLPVGLGRARGHRQPRRLRPHPAHEALGREARLLRPGHQRALHAARHRAGRRRHPHDDGVPARRLRRGGGAGRDAHRAAPAPPPGALQGGRAAAVEEGHAHPGRPRRAGPPAAPLHVRLRRDPGHRSPLPPPGRAGHAVLRHRRLRLARRLRP